MKNETFMKEKPVLPLIISMALPMVISMCVNSLYNIVDSYFVAKISENAMTALSLFIRFKTLLMLLQLASALALMLLLHFTSAQGIRIKQTTLQPKVFCFR